jgi:hypothetical protein
MVTVSPRHTIERLGYKVTGGDGEPLKVKLPLLCSLRVSANENGEYSITPYFGLVRRSTATWTLEVTFVLVFLIILWGDPDNPKLIATALVAMVMGMVHDVYRYVLTEAAIIRIATSLIPRNAA